MGSGILFFEEGVEGRGVDENGYVSFFDEITFFPPGGEGFLFFFGESIFFFLFAGGRGCYMEWGRGAGLMKSPFFFEGRGKWDTFFLRGLKGETRTGAPGVTYTTGPEHEKRVRGRKERQFFLFQGNKNNCIPSTPPRASENRGTPWACEKIKKKEKHYARAGGTGDVCVHGAYGGGGGRERKKEIWVFYIFLFHTHTSSRFSAKPHPFLSISPTPPLHLSPTITTFSVRIEGARGGREKECDWVLNTLGKNDAEKRRKSKKRKEKREEDWVKCTGIAGRVGIGKKNG